MSEAVILCEGYHDRAFLAGWLEHLGCQQPPAGGSVYDNAGRKVAGGQFGYPLPDGDFVRVVPCHGKPNVRTEASLRLRQRANQPSLRHLVLCLDADQPTGEDPTAAGMQPNDILALARKFDANATFTDDGDVSLDDDARRISLVRWRAPDAADKGLPDLQTLERLACAAVIAAYPDRAAPVAQWLASRPNPPSASPKDYAWSYMAGWYAERGCDAFYRTLWNDPEVVPELQSRLIESEAWRVIASLVREP